MSGSPDLRPLVLVVDDTPENLYLMRTVLKDTYRTRLANTGEAALELAAEVPGPDLILLDVMMPGLDGYEVLARLKADPATADIPVIFLTACTGDAEEEKGLSLGAADFLTKPINPPIVLARVRNHILVKRAHDFLKDRNQYLNAEIERRTKEIHVIQDVTIMAMASLAETRDNETGYHIKRTQWYVKELAMKLRDHPRFREVLNDEGVDLMFKSAPLHDIGKIGIPDHILLKPGRFTPEEFEIMKRHTTIGRDAIRAAEARLNVPNSFLRFAREIAYCHQEKWDGTGYPQGLRGEAIPVSARLMAVADVYDALISPRVYKPPFSHEEAVRIIREGAGSHFDPDVAAAFEAVSFRFREIASHFTDQPVPDGIESLKH
ncbi:MAG: two-component system response regulator [Candidatus Riflebacteria bacterium]|nr:two-component system response regulator [Candidatus Riflebacteria bacterium]